MSQIKNKVWTIFCLIILNVYLLVGISSAQQQTKPNIAEQDVIKIDTDLVQTQVSVFDKRGRFVEGLERDQFELRVDGQRVPISFFERVSSGNIRESGVASEKRSSPANANTSLSSLPQNSVHGRVIIFFIDDLHLSHLSVERTRQTIEHFIANEMSPFDKIAIASASGQIGFLQQFTDKKAVLRAALSRLKPIPYTVRDTEQVPMTEYNALKILQGNGDVLSYYVNQLQIAFSTRKGGGLSADSAKNIVKTRANSLLKQSLAVTSGTLTGLESLMRSSSQIQGRKLVFFISDGFFLDYQNSDVADRLQHITDAAVRSGIVIYSMDARGLVQSNSYFADSTSNRADPLGQFARGSIGELESSQAPLTWLASETGGHVLINSNALEDSVSKSLKETSRFYLLAWQPITENSKGGKFKKIEVNVIGHSDLIVRLQRGYISDTRVEDAREDKSDSKNTNGKSDVIKNALQSALSSFAPIRALSTEMALSFLDTPNHGTVLTVSTQIGTQTLKYGDDGLQTAEIDIAGLILNAKGQRQTDFQTRLIIQPSNTYQPKTNNRGVIYNFRAPLKPGLYQVRVAVRDNKSGQVGSTNEWIEIPDLSKRNLTISSLLLGGKFIARSNANDNTQNIEPTIQFSVDRRFVRKENLNVLLFVYNATINDTKIPDVTAQFQVLQGDGSIAIQSLIPSPPENNLTDTSRLPFSVNVPLNNLLPGHYLLQVTVGIPKSKVSATEQIDFWVE